jgi:hypothetical protein
LVDGVFNSIPGIQRTLINWRTTEASFSQAWRLARPSFYNPSPLMRPVGPNFFLRGFLQRAVPLFMGIAALDRYRTGQWISPMFWKNMRDVAAVSAGSAGLLRLVYSSEGLSSTLVRRGLLTDAAAGAGGARFGLTFRGALALATVEMIALGIINAHERRSLIDETGRALRQQLGQAIDRRNELITRLESGEDIAPRYLVAADGDLQNAQATYRRFLELTEHRRGSGSFTAIDSGNDFDEEQRRYEGALSAAVSGNDPMARARAEADHEARLRSLQGRYQRMEQELDNLYASQGVDRRSSENGESLRDFLHRQAAQLEANPSLAESGADAPPPPATVSAPVAVDSDEGHAILEQMRWKAAQDPSFVLWSRERRADYIREQFRGYRVSEPDGSSRPWNRTEALAFLDSVDQANAQRMNNLEAPLTMPTPQEHFDTSRLEALIRSEQEIRGRELEGHTHATAHASSLADNVEDLDRQMESYYHSSNERTALALTRIMGGPQVAMVSPEPGSSALQ